MLHFVFAAGKYPVIIQHGSIGTVQVFDQVPVAAQYDLRMAARYHLGVKVDIGCILRRAPSNHRRWLAQLEYFTHILCVTPLDYQKGQIAPPFIQSYYVRAL